MLIFSINLYFRDAYNELNPILRGVSRATTPYTDELYGLTNSTNFFDFLDCSFMSLNLADIVTISNNIATDTIGMCGIIAALSFVNIFFLVFGLIFYLRRSSALKLREDELKREAQEEEGESDINKLELQDEIRDNVYKEGNEDNTINNNINKIDIKT